jgi:hypothetical protein
MLARQSKESLDVGRGLNGIAADRGKYAGVEMRECYARIMPRLCR